MTQKEDISIKNSLNVPRWGEDEDGTDIKTSKNDIEESPYFNLSSFTFKGRKSSNEDRIAVISNFEDSEGFFGIYDGHAGQQCSEFISVEIPRCLSDMMVQFEPAEALINTYTNVDKNWLSLAKDGNLKDGSTAISVLIKNGTLYCANTGDCRAIMYANNQIIQLSEDHKPDNPKELERINSHGGVVIGGRVQGQIAVSRAFGDIDYKDIDTLEEKWITCTPDIKEYELNAEVEFIVIACDGLWDVLNNEETVEFVKQQLNNNIPHDKIAENLVQEAFELKSQDNISAVLIFLKKKKYKKFLTKISRKKKKTGGDNLETHSLTDKKTSPKGGKHVIKNFLAPKEGKFLSKSTGDLPQSVEPDDQDSNGTLGTTKHITDRKKDKKGKKKIL